MIWPVVAHRYMESFERARALWRASRLHDPLDAIYFAPAARAYLCCRERPASFQGMPEAVTVPFLIEVASRRTSPHWTRFC